MAYCINCGNRNTDNAKFCANCGEEITIFTEEGQSKHKKAPKEKQQSTKDSAPITVEEGPTKNDSEIIEESDGAGFSGCFKIRWIIVLIIGIILLATNPSKSDLAQYVTGDSTGTGLEEVLYDSFTDVNRKNYLLFSTYEIELNILGIVTRERYIGIFNRFIQLE